MKKLNDLKFDSNIKEKIQLIPQSDSFKKAETNKSGKMNKMKADEKKVEEDEDDNIQKKLNEMTRLAT